MKLLSLLVAAAMLTACGANDSANVQNAKGETPAKYIICDQSESNCFVAARFKDLQACQSHKEWADMLCDKKTSPSVMVCKEDTGVPIGTAYCTL